MARPVVRYLVVAAALGGLAGACGDNKVRLTDAGVPADAAPQVDADPSELQVIETTPRANQVVMDREAGIQVRFDRAVDIMSIDGSNFWAMGQWSGVHKGVYRFEEGETLAILEPPKNFIAGEQVTVVLGNSIEGAESSSMRPAGYSFQFRVGSAAASMTFTEAAVVPTRNEDDDPGQSYGGVASDLNDDGYPDVTIVNEMSEDLVIFMNRGDGSGLLDKQPESYAVGLRPSPSEPADFDGDGIIDLCVANIGSGVTVLKGVGDGTFENIKEYAAGNAPRGITVLDADGDGDMDIVNTNYLSDELSVFLNKGDGTFEPARFVDGGANGEWAVAAADMNEDGILDLVVGSHADGVISVLTGDGAGGFNLRSTQSGPTGLWMIVTGDLNGDGHADATVAGGFADVGSILLGDGSGNLSAPEHYGTDPSTSATDVGDLDGDGDLDWITSSFGGANSDWFFWLNDGTGNFTKLQEYDSTRDASCALLVDLDLDGDLDLGLIDEGEDEMIILHNE